MTQSVAIKNQQGKQDPTLHVSTWSLSVSEEQACMGDRERATWKLASPREALSAVL